MSSMVRSFAELRPEEWAPAGGKGGTLARLYQAGYPVPDGLVILPAAFAGERLLPEAWAQIQAGLQRLRRGRHDAAFAVRSSALSEDSAQASFAGAFETVLDVSGDEEIRRAIDTVRGSRLGERVRAYSQAKGAGEQQQIAVVVQRLVRADLAGVLFTADPITGSRTRMAGNLVHGLGERLVAGEADPDSFALKRPRGEYSGPSELQGLARQLYRLAVRVERKMGCPQDIEWAVEGRRVYLLQSRPITTLQAYRPETGEWNDSLTGDYLWASTNLAEAAPHVMTPSSWSLLRRMLVETSTAAVPDNLPPLVGNLGGRIYTNVTLLVSMHRLAGMKPQEARRRVEELFGRLPDGLEVESIPVLTLADFFRLLPENLRLEALVRNETRRAPQFVAETPAWCERMEQRIGAAQTAVGLAALWQEEIRPYVDHASYVLRGMMREFDDPAGRLRAALTKQVGEADANALLSGLSGGSEVLASLGPLVGLARVAQGALSRADYARQYGHRGPDEFELMAPRPAEDPAWLDGALASAASPADVESLLAKQQAEGEAAWRRLQERCPRQVKGIRRRLDLFAAGARRREAVRSEVTRVFAVVRQFLLRAGEMTGLGDGVFYLSLDEMLDVVRGNRSAAALIPARRETHARYSALPRYPAVINGRFDALRWAADPNRRSDIYDSHATHPLPAADTITGFAGAAGIVEGRVRRLNDPDEAADLQAGEILVTITTNIGWTPLFPRVAAIVTDVGAPLSHAAIVARELGIPAVVGCGSATMRLRTGDRVRVDGAAGSVHILERADDAHPAR